VPAFLPCTPQLRAIQTVPFDDVGQRTRRKLPLYDARFNLDGDFVFSVACVKVRRRMIVQNIEITIPRNLLILAAALPSMLVVESGGVVGEVLHRRLA